jgi:hypothetical protein
MKIRKIKSRNKERGTALLIVLFALMLATAIVFGMMYSSTADTAANANFRDEQRAYFAARAGLEEARARLQDTNPNPIVAPTAMPDPLAQNVIYITNPKGNEVINPAAGDYQDTEFCLETFGAQFGAPCLLPNNTSWYLPVDSIAPGTHAADALAYKWTRITLKTNNSGTTPNVWVDSTKNAGLQVCWNGSNQNAIPAGSTCAAQVPEQRPVWVLTSLAVTPNGSKRITQLEVATSPPIITNAAIDSQVSVKLQGKLDINAYDYCNCDANGNNLPGKICDKSKWAVYSGNNVNQAGNAMTIESSQPATCTTNNCSNPAGTAAGQVWPPPSLTASIPDMIQQFQNMPGVVQACATDCGTEGQAYGAQSSDFPSAGPTPNTMNPQITYFGGNTKLSGGTTGSGILIVNGDLDIHGGLAFYGLILVKGTIDFTGGANDVVNTYGAFLNGGDVNATNQVTGLDSFGGSAVIHYDSCALKVLNQHQLPSVLASRELAYQ